PRARRHRPLAAGLSARPAACALADPAAGAVLAVGFAGAGRDAHARPGPGAGPARGLRIRAGARALLPGPCRPFARVLARGGSPLPGLARVARLLRSEERRVGKEGRWRWSPDHVKQKLA